MIDKDCYSYIFVCDNCGEGEEVSTWNEVKDCYSEMVVCDNCGEGEVRENAARGKGGG